MLDFEERPDYESTAQRYVTRSVSDPRVRLASRTHLNELTRINRMLEAINRHLAGRHLSEPTLTTLEALRAVGTRVAREIGDSLDCSATRAGIAERYLAGIDKLIVAYAEAESMLDDDTLAWLDWYAQEIRLEYLRAGISVRNVDSTDRPVEPRCAA